MKWSSPEPSLSAMSLYECVSSDIAGISSSYWGPVIDVRSRHDAATDNHPMTSRGFSVMCRAKISTLLAQTSRK